LHHHFFEQALRFSSRFCSGLKKKIDEGKFHDLGDEVKKAIVIKKHLRAANPRLAYRAPGGW
jgi:hypothetical protein